MVSTERVHRNQNDRRTRGRFDVAAAEDCDRELPWARQDILLLNMKQSNNSSGDHEHPRFPSETIGYVVASASVRKKAIPANLEVEIGV
jgi:hypothetical protein